MATQAVHQPIYRYNFYGLKTPTWGGPEKPHFIETAAQTYNAGDLLYIDSNGTVAIATTTSDALDVTIVGQATKDATGVTGAAVHMRPIIPGDVYLMNLFHTTAASSDTTQAVFASGTHEKGIWWKTGALPSGSNENWVVDMITDGESATTAQAYGKVIGCPALNPDGTSNAITDTYPNVEFMFMNYTFSTDAAADPVQRRCLYFGG